jgi:vacuolar-type H+-ATPase subunit F/Vma7
MMSIGNLSIAIIGDEDLINGLRLAGVARYCVIKDDHDIRDDVGKALTELISDPDIGIIAIREDYMEHVEDLVNQVREEKRLTPVIIGVPSKYGAKYEDVTGYYKSYVRKFTGFNIEI